MPGKDERVSGRAAGASGPGGAAGAADTAARTARDHAAIARLADDLLPALIAKLGASGLGEIEVREGQWKARLRKPAGTGEKPHSTHALPTRPAGSPARAAAEEPARDATAEEPPANLPIMATSPAVGVFSPRKETPAGSRVRAGDRIGSVDVLGVREDVVAPVDGIVGVLLVESGEAVEYGQELIKIELPESARAGAAVTTDREAAAVLGEA